jgi:hypothetical protein
VHKELLKKSTENRDVILSMPCDLVYYVDQLWCSKDNAGQWLYFLCMIKKEVPFWQWRRRKCIQQDVICKWYVLMKAYGESFDDETIQKCTCQCHTPTK